MMGRLLKCFFLLFSAIGFCQDLEDGLVVHYEFNGDFNDATSNNFHAENEGVVFVNDQNGNPNSALYFNGLNSYINLPNEDDLKPEMPFSISFWIKYSSNDYDSQEVFELSYEENRNSGVYFNSEVHLGKMAINIANGLYNYVSTARKSYVSNNVIETDEWINVVAVVNSAHEMEIYYNCKGMGGNFSGSASTLVYSDNNGVIGKRQRYLNSNPSYFHGYLDDFKIWNRALSLNEVSSVCTALSNDSFQENLPQVTIYPNPSSGNLNIQSSLLFERIEVLDQIGKTVYSGEYQNQLNLSNMSSGVYFIKLSGSEASTIKKIILK